LGNEEAGRPYPEEEQSDDDDGLHALASVA
jgi:hypothetical protein